MTSAQCRSEPVTLAIGSGNSIIEWLLLPKLGAIHDALPNVIIDLIDERTQDNVRALNDLSLEIAIIRKSAVPAHLKSASLGSVEFALFVPRELIKGVKPEIRVILPKIRIATSKGGSFREALDKTAAKAKIKIDVALACSSFTQAARAARNGNYAAILPRLAVVDLPEYDFGAVNLPFLKKHTRPLCLVWNPRLASVRPIVAKAITLISTALPEI